MLDYYHCPTDADAYQLHAPATWQLNVYERTGPPADQVVADQPTPAAPPPAPAPAPPPAATTPTPPTVPPSTSTPPPPAINVDSIRNRPD